MGGIKQVKPVRRFHYDAAVETAIDGMCDFIFVIHKIEICVNSRATLALCICLVDLGVGNVPLNVAVRSDLEFPSFCHYLPYKETSNCIKRCLLYFLL